MFCNSRVISRYTSINDYNGYNHCELLLILFLNAVFIVILQNISFKEDIIWIQGTQILGDGEDNT